MKKDDLIGGALLLAALLGLGAFFVFAEPAPELAYGPVDVPGSLVTAEARSDREVAISATVIEPGFVTIHRSIGAAPGPIIGTSAYMLPGTIVDLPIALTETTEPGLTYIALLHVDNGDERFVSEDDMPVTSGGASVRADFVAK